MRIHWMGKSTNGLSKWKARADTMHELYRTLVDKDVISVTDEDPYENYVLDKYNKSIDAPEFQNADGDVDYDKVQESVESHCISDNELWELIAECNGNAYYQTFMVENADGELVELDELHLMMLEN